METSIALMVLGAALFHATWNALVKSGKDHLLSITGLNFVSLVIGVIALPFFGFPDKASWPYLLASGLIHFGYYVALSEAYRHGDFSGISCSSGNCPHTGFSMGRIYSQ